MDKKKKTRKSGSAKTARDLPLKTLPAGKQKAAAVKGGRITNVRANASGVPAGSGGASPIQASISISGK